MSNLAKAIAAQQNLQAPRKKGSRKPIPLGEQIRIKELLAEGLSQTEISLRVGVSRTVVKKIKAGEYGR